MTLLDQAGQLTRCVQESNEYFEARGGDWMVVQLAQHSGLAVTSHAPLGQSLMSAVFSARKIEKLTCKWPVLWR